MSFLSNLGQMFAQTDYETYSDPSYYETMEGMSQGAQVNDAAAAGIAVATLLFFLFVIVVGYVINAFMLSRIFKKVGIESWKAWVPVYNVWIMLELGGQPGWMAVLLLIPFVNIIATVFLFIAQYHIGLKFGKEGMFVLLAIFLPIVWLAWLAFDKSTWQGPKPVTATANGASAPTTEATSQPEAPKTDAPSTPKTPPKV